LEKRLSGVAELRCIMVYGKSQLIIILSRIEKKSTLNEVSE
jgi:hypothetical protein